MKCPDCNIEMEWGNIYLKGTALGFLFLGWSYKHCYFDAFNSDSERVKVLDNSETKRGFYCNKCGMVIIPPQE